jgi:hypothetical protein
MSELAKWDSFYVIVGSAAGALIGLQFVVVTLISERPPLRAADAGAAFATPTIVHFVATLLLSALLRAPWETVTVAAALCGLMGFSGVAYVVIVARRMRRQAVYKPEFEDWLFHVVLPLAAYATLALSPFAAPSREREAPVRRRGRGTAPALRRHSQRLGRRHVPRLRQQDGSRSRAEPGRAVGEGEPVRPERARSIIEPESSKDQLPSCLAATAAVRVRRIESRPQNS